MRQKWIAIAATLMLMLTTYVLAYAPYLAYRYKEPQYSSQGGWACSVNLDQEPYYSENQHLPFAPVEWLIDHTPLQTPLLWWARIWGCENKMSFDSATRYFNRRCKF